MLKILIKLAPAVVDCDLSQPIQPCENKCIFKYTKEKIKKAGKKPKCEIRFFWREIARFEKKDGEQTKEVEVKLGLLEKQEGFTEDLVKYDEWNTAKNPKSHYVLDYIRQDLCKHDEESYYRIHDNFIYDFNYAARNETRTYKSIPDDDIVYFQLKAECGEKPKFTGRNHFAINFDIIAGLAMAPYTANQLHKDCVVEWKYNMDGFYAKDTKNNC